MTAKRRLHYLGFKICGRYKYHVGNFKLSKHWQRKISLPTEIAKDFPSAFDDEKKEDFFQAEGLCKFITCILLYP